MGESDREGKGRPKESSDPKNGLKTLLTIGGHDLSNGAGITKDLEVFSVLGFRGISVPTSFVVQGPGGVRGITPVDERLFGEMLAQAREDFSLSGIKIGVLADRGHVERIASFLGDLADVPVVLDPVVAAKNNTRLVTDQGLAALSELLSPLITCLTPNIDEAQLLLGEEIGHTGAMEGAARKLAAMGPRSVVLKGGHLPGDPVDLLFDGRESIAYGKKRIEKLVHGTGCMFSSSLCAFLALGYPVKEAFFEAEKEIEGLITGSSRPAEGGYFYAYPGLNTGRTAARTAVLVAMADAACRINRLDMIELVPAGRMNMCYAAAGARTREDAACLSLAVDCTGRLRGEGAPVLGEPALPADLCLLCMRRYPFLRAAATVKYDPAIAGKAREAGLSVISGEGHGGPGSIGETFCVAFEHADAPPDIVYEPEGTGHEPIMAVFARNLEELIKKMEMIKPCATN